MEALNITKHPSIRGPPVLSPAVAPQNADRSLRRLHPMSEPINGQRAFENKQGEIFVLKEVRYPAGVFSDQLSIHVSLEQLAADSAQAYRVIARMRVNGERLSVDSVKSAEDKSSGYPAPKDERKGYGFLPIILEEAKRIAKEAGAKVIRGVPATDQVAELCQTLGFRGFVESTLHL